MDIHQSKKYGQYMKKIGWEVERINGCQVFIRPFPLIGSLIKIQRPNFPILFPEIEKIAKKYRAFKIIIEPNSTKQRNNETIEQLESSGYQKSASPYLPTKTILIDLTRSKKEIFQSFSEAKRRGVRRAIKNGVIVEESKDIESFIKLKSRQFSFLGFLLKREIHVLWQTLYHHSATLLLAKRYDDMNHHSKTVAGVLLLFYEKTAYYWLAASTKIGKKLFAPTLLVWQALKLAKKKGCKVFDFEGIYDPRLHQATKSWLGFTRFKKGFGGREIKYPGCFVKSKLPFI